MLIGNNQAANVAHPGLISACGFLNGKILTAGELNQWYRDFSKMPRMSGWWKPGIWGSQGTVIDQSGNGFHGTITSALVTPVTPLILPSQTTRPTRRLLTVPI